MHKSTSFLRRDNIDRKFAVGNVLRHFFAARHRDNVCVATEMKMRLVLRCLVWDFAGGDYGHRSVRGTHARRESAFMAHQMEVSG